jgi:hypothetical protein
MLEPGSLAVTLALTGSRCIGIHFCGLAIELNGTLTFLLCLIGGTTRRDLSLAGALGSGLSFQPVLLGLLPLMLDFLCPASLGGRDNKKGHENYRSDDDDDDQPIRHLVPLCSIVGLFHPPPPILGKTPGRHRVTRQLERR